jgi:hypothetical protein
VRDISTERAIPDQTADLGCGSSSSVGLFYQVNDEIKPKTGLPAMKAAGSPVFWDLDKLLKQAAW